MKKHVFLLCLSMFLSVIIISCGRDELLDEAQEVSDSQMMMKPPLDSLIIDTTFTKPTINATIFTTGQTCYSLASGYGYNYRYYVSASDVVSYDRVVHSTIIKGTALYFVQPLTIPAYQNVSENVIIFNNESSKVGDVKIRILSVLNSNVETLQNYNRVDYDGYINNCFSRPFNQPDSCYDENLVPIDNNHDGIWDCMQ
ncbi:hypothetical protein OF897_18300 [Chryseobacterium formosus]|uniref:Lipoprotein n=1 Tax=Chryseobacterium formosus TaxID=1537363 RepID=A0ABT3XW28_9FLAO|nr:hypothetical protein [Chryseobacterium formosus]MCX8525869.1 hypothetical protein [Chryseobacterium formosus]